MAKKSKTKAKARAKSSAKGAKRKIAAKKAARKPAAKKAVKPIPDGYHSLTPFTIIPEAADAIAFYEKAFGAKTRLRMDMPDGGIAHAELQIGDSVLMIASGDKDKYPPQSLMAMIYVKNCDAVFDRALDAGATVKEPLSNKFYGDRSGTVIDPFGNQWSIATHVEDVSEAEMERRMAQQGQGGGDSEEE